MKREQVQVRVRSSLLVTLIISVTTVSSDPSQIGKTATLTCIVSKLYSDVYDDYS